MPSAHRTSPAQYCVTLVGCGKMGGAMMRSWLNNNLIQKISVFEPSDLPDAFSSNPVVNHETSYQGQAIESDILILAIKPQILKEAAATIAQNLSEDTVVLSIAAGQSISSLETIFGTDRPIVRVMPNLPASIGKGIGAAITNSLVTTEQKEMAENLLQASGETIWIEDESLMDSVTALSATGAAYIFYLIETMAQAGESLGLSHENSMQLARQTVIGSAALAEHAPETSAATLRKNVTSPGGTTQAALEILMDGRFQDLITESLKAAKNRSIELNK